jgi:hypothetical protein
MKTIKYLILLIGVIIAILFAQTARAFPLTLIDGTLTTNVSIAVGATYPTNTIYPGVVLGLATNTYNLYNGIGYQANTNLWPSVGFSPLGSYPNTVYGPFRNVEFYIAGDLQATNTTSTAVVYRFAGSVDGNRWVSNYYTFTETVAVNTKSPGAWITNFDTGAMPYISLQTIENPGANALTNIILIENGKPGL